MRDLRADEVVLGAGKTQSFVRRGSLQVYMSELAERLKTRESVPDPEPLLYCNMVIIVQFVVYVARCGH